MFCSWSWSEGWSCLEARGSTLLTLARPRLTPIGSHGGSSSAGIHKPCFNILVRCAVGGRRRKNARWRSDVGPYMQSTISVNLGKRRSGPRQTDRVREEFRGAPCHHPRASARRVRETPDGRLPEVKEERTPQSQADTCSSRGQRKARRNENHHQIRTIKEACVRVHQQGLFQARSHAKCSLLRLPLQLAPPTHATHIHPNKDRAQPTACYLFCEEQELSRPPTLLLFLSCLSQYSYSCSYQD